nr:hypothetical protein BgiMline_019111 [Biomphalaria glabrata]
MRKRQDLKIEVPQQDLSESPIQDYSGSYPNSYDSNKDDRKVPNILSPNSSENDFDQHLKPFGGSLWEAFHIHVQSVRTAAEIPVWPLWTADRVSVDCSPLPCVVPVTRRAHFCVVRVDCILYVVPVVSS